MITVPEAAHYLRLHRLRMYQMVREHHFPVGVVHRFGRSIRIHKGALDRFLSSGEQA